MKQSITLRLDKDLIRRTRAAARRRSTSSRGLLTGELTRIVERVEAYDRAERSAVRAPEIGFPLGGHTCPRDELHDR